VIVTGSYGRCGTALIDHLDGDERYEFTYLNRSDRPPEHPYGDYETVVADVTDRVALVDAFDGQDAVVHLTGVPAVDASWTDALEANIVGTYNALEAARTTDVDSFVFASTNHVMGGYEAELAPEVYRPGHGIALTHDDPTRPDSYYGVSKSFGEDIGRYYIENESSPERFYALRICSVRHAEYDQPYGDAERGVDEGTHERGSEAYERTVARMKAMWHSRRDFAHLVECCLRDDDVDFGVFNGVSDNDRRWFSLENARSRLGYSPEDNGEEWTAPPDRDSSAP